MRIAFLRQLILKTTDLQIKFLLGHSSIQTTERYLGSEQDIEIAVNDNLGL
jgi:site-specific recombinase XerD